ncbi:MAG: hypothetical protein ABEI74_01715 [Candidatus Pacearchaeota archaeon]
MKFEITTLASEFIIYTKQKSSNEKVKIHKELFGHKDTTHGYTYIKDGILSNVKYIKPTESTIIVSMANAKTVREFLKKRKTAFNEKIVILNKEDAQKLGINTENQWEKNYEEIKKEGVFRTTIEF